MRELTEVNIGCPFCGGGTEIKIVAVGWYAEYCTSKSCNGIGPAFRDGGDEAGGRIYQSELRKWWKLDADHEAADPRLAWFSKLEELSKCSILSHRPSPYAIPKCATLTRLPND